MIRQLLDRHVLRAAASTLLELFKQERDDLTRGDRDTAVAAFGAGATGEDIDRAAEQVDEWQKQEAADISDPSGKPPIWIASDPITSLMQSSFEELFTDRGLTWKTKRTGFGAGEEPISDIELTDEALELITQDDRRRRFWPKFGQRDARFFTWGAAAKISTWAKGGRYPFPDTQGPQVQISDTARLILVSDWGSGVPRAEKTATAMRVHVEESLRNEQECHVIHLGDVYYCGWQRELEERFLGSELWPVPASEKGVVGSWALNANHEMYSGGRDYFAFLLQEDRFRRQQGCSFFALENSHWQIAALDSAYTDADLHGDQATWLSKMRKASPNKKGLLLSHHQPFCVYSTITSTLLDRVRDVTNEGLVRAWFFGHEHKFAAYGERDGIKYPRLIGHGGVPVYAYASHPRPNGVIEELTDTMTDPKTGWKFARFGFTVLDCLADGSINARYVTEHGTTHYQEPLV